VLFAVTCLFQFTCAVFFTCKSVGTDSRSIKFSCVYTLAQNICLVENLDVTVLHRAIHTLNFFGDSKIAMLL